MTTTTDTAILSALKAAALAALETLQGTPADEDDCGMFDASSDDLLAWVDDLEARVGYDAADMRAHVIDYCLLRDGDPEACDVRSRYAVDAPRVFTRTGRTDPLRFRRVRAAWAVMSAGGFAERQRTAHACLINAARP